MKRNNIIKIVAVTGYFLFLLISLVQGFNPGKEIGYNFVSFSVDMLKILPGAFILIGLFEVWVKREAIDRHFGEESGLKGYLLAILLSGVTVGGGGSLLPGLLSDPVGSFSTLPLVLGNWPSTCPA